MKNIILVYIAPVIALVIFCGGCGGSGSIKMEGEAFPSSGESSGNDAMSSSTNRSEKEAELAPQLNPLAGAGYVSPPDIGNYGTVGLAYPVDVPGGRAGMAPRVSLNYSSSGGDGPAGIGWSLSTGTGSVSRSANNGEIYYDSRDTFTINGARLIKVSGPAGSENGTYRKEIESDFSRYEFSDAENGGVWRIYDSGGTVTVYGADRTSRVYDPIRPYKTYIWNFSRSTDMKGNYMEAQWDSGDYHETNMIHLSEIRYTGNEKTGMPCRQAVRFRYKKRVDAYISKQAGFVMKLDRLLDRIEITYSAPGSMFTKKLWDYELVYEDSPDSSRPLLKTVNSSRRSTAPAFTYNAPDHSLVWQKVFNPFASDPEMNPASTRYFEGDFNGDGISDMVFFNPVTGDWKAAEGKAGGGYLFKNYGRAFQGYSGPTKIQFFKGGATGDYNGDGRSDIAFFLPETGEFYAAEHNGSVFEFKRKGRLDVPVDIMKCQWFPGDYDGDGLSDTVLFHEPTGEWFFMKNSGGGFAVIKFSEAFRNLFRKDYHPGINFSSPGTTDLSEQGLDRGRVNFFTGDFNGDGRTDISIYDSRSGDWLTAENYRDDSIGFRLQWIRYAVFKAPAKTLFSMDSFSGDFNGDGFSDFMFYDRETGRWIIGETGDRRINFRVFSKMPVDSMKDITRHFQGDFNGDGRADIAFYCASDNRLWAAESVPGGFRYRVYNDLSYGPDPAKVMAVPAPEQDVVIETAAAVSSIKTDSGGKTDFYTYEYNGNIVPGAGERVWPGYFSSADEPGFLIYRRQTDTWHYRQGRGPVSGPISFSMNPEAENINIYKGRSQPAVQRTGGLYSGLIVSEKRSYYGETVHDWSAIETDGTLIRKNSIGSVSTSDAAAFSAEDSLYAADFFKKSACPSLVVLDDFRESASQVKFLLYQGGAKTELAVTADPGNPGQLANEYFLKLRQRGSAIRLFTGRFTQNEHAELLLLDMTAANEHKWYLASIEAASISFTKLTGRAQFTAALQGRGIHYTTGSENKTGMLVYASAAGPSPAFRKITVTGETISQKEYSALSEKYIFTGDFTHDCAPVVKSAEGRHRAALGIESAPVLTLLKSSAEAAHYDRPDLLKQVYVFQWMQGDYNGDGKTDLGIFHMKEPQWYFALSRGVVADLLTEVDNGIGGKYYFEYADSTSFDNRDENGIHRLPMNYKVCVRRTVDDGFGRRVSVKYGYAGGYAFSAYINGRKETDYFGFTKFTVEDAAGSKTVSSYHSVPNADYRKNRALAGAVKETVFHGSDNREYARTKHAYLVREISSAPGTISYLIEPVKVERYMNGVKTDTVTSNIELAPAGYVMLSKTETGTDHYTDPAHRETAVETYSEYSYNESTNETRLTKTVKYRSAPEEVTAEYEYDPEGSLIKETTRYTGRGLTPAAPVVMEYEYDGYGLPVRAVNSSASPARVTEKSYDHDLNQYIAEERSAGDGITLVTKYETDYGTAFGSPIRKTDPNAASTWYIYDTYGRLQTQKADYKGSAVILADYEYDTEFPLSAKVTRHTGTEKYMYRGWADGTGRTLHTVSAAGTSASAGRYVKSGMRVYDTLGRPVRDSQPDWCGDDEINSYKAHSAERHPTVTEYDPAGRVVRVTLPQNPDADGESSVSYAYNGPWETVETRSAGRTKRTIKNSGGLVLYVEERGPSESGPSGIGDVSAMIGFAYDLAGRRIKKMDLNEIESPAGPGGAASIGISMEITIDPALFAAGKKDISGKNICQWRYDGLGRLTETSDTDLGYSKREYNAFGEPVKTTDAMERVTEYEYDRMGRLTIKKLPGSEGQVRYIYDSYAGSSLAAGRPAAIISPAEKKVMSYDSLGRIVRELRTVFSAESETAPASEDETFETLFEHDLTGRTVKITYPEDRGAGTRLVLTNSYGAAGIDRVEFDNGKIAKEIIRNTEYNAAGRPLRIARGDGTVTEYTYDLWHRLSALVTLSASGTGRLQDVKYKFNLDNTIASVINDAESSADSEMENRQVRYSYAYDGLGRLIHAAGGLRKGGDPETDIRTFKRGYSYSASGNLTGRTIINETMTEEEHLSYTYTGHAVTSVIYSGGRVINMHYDPAGNMIMQADSLKGVKVMEYDSGSRVTRVLPEQGPALGEYQYDEQGYRVRKISRIRGPEGERVTEIVSPSMYFSLERELLNEADNEEPGPAAVNNIYVNGVRCAAVDSHGNARFYHTDQVDSVKLVTNAAGEVLTSYEYTPYGETWFTEGSEDNAPKYNSQELDEESGFYYYNARHYDPEISRFVTADTVIDGEYSTQGWNRYMYCRGNPVVFRDPTGHYRNGLWGLGDMLHAWAGSGGAYGKDYAEGKAAAPKVNDTTNNAQAKKLNKSNDTVVKNSSVDDKAPDFGSPIENVIKKSDLDSRKATANGKLTSLFGFRKDPFTGATVESHPGIDITADSGTKIKASASGVISYHLDKKGEKDGYGYYAMIEHENGYQTRYAHMNKKDWEEGSEKNKQWSRVEKGSEIGGVGSSGRSTASHLHFEIRKNNEAIDPESILKQNLKD
jgi:RHS repeat-associated protein